jgi:alpha-tubulin suppressor-like RCC1 family protein
MWSWGYGTYGALGLGDTTTQYSPVQVGALTTWSSITAGTLYSLAIKTNGTMWAWGPNGYGQLGQGNTTARSSPVQIGAGTTWSSVAAGESHSLAIIEE